MTSWVNLAAGTPYNDVIDGINARTLALLKNDFASDTSIPIGAIRINPDTLVHERYNGSAWVAINFSALRLANNARLVSINPSGADVSLMYLGGDGSAMVNTDAAGCLYFCQGGTAKWYFHNTNFNFSPLASDTYEIGQSARRVKRLHVQRGIAWPVNLTNAAGSTQADAAAVTFGIARVNNTVSTRGVKLPAISSVGDICILTSAGTGSTASTKVYPASDESIENLAANASVVGITPTGTSIFVAVTATCWAWVYGA